MLNVPVALATEQSDLIDNIDALIEEHGGGRDALIPVLQDLRKKRHDISDLAMQVLADRLGLSPVEVQGVATFYSFLQVGVTGQHTIRVCRTLSCSFAGATSIAKKLEAELGISMGETTADGQVTLEWANCIGMCDQAPALLADQAAIGSLTAARVGEIVANLKASKA
jgi:NADH:ubiquinone oxidoreductase subunit E